LGKADFYFRAMGCPGTGLFSKQGYKRIQIYCSAIGLDSGQRTNRHKLQIEEGCWCNFFLPQVYRNTESPFFYRKSLYCVNLNHFSIFCMPTSNTEAYKNLASFLNRFIPLADDEFSLLKKRITLRHYPKKHIFIREGETEQKLFFVHSGLIHHYFYKDKEQVTTDLVMEGTITGSVASFLSGRPSHYYLETMEPTIVLSITKQSLQELYRSDKKWQRFGRILITHFLLQQEKHILDNIRYSIREKLVHFAEEYPALLKRVPQRRLASYLDMKPETFTRLKPLIEHKKKSISK
jgi:CRP-like cAMP-binding protein